MKIAIGVLLAEVNFCIRNMLKQNVEFGCISVSVPIFLYFRLNIEAGTDLSFKAVSPLMITW